MSFSGLSLIGCEKLAGIYGMNEGIIDAKGTGVQHLFYNGFGQDLVHSAVTLIKDGDKIYYGNRAESLAQHPVHLKPKSTAAENGYIFTDQFDCGVFNKTEKAYAWDEANLGFDIEIENNTDVERVIEIYAYVILQPHADRHLKSQTDAIIAAGEDCQIGIQFSGAEKHSMLVEGPTGFIYRLTSTLLQDDLRFDDLEIADDMLSGILIGRKFTLPANGCINASWSMTFADTETQLKAQMVANSGSDRLNKATEYWETYLASGHPLNSDHPQFDRINQVAIKSATINGFVPADLTGFYYADGLPCFYPRDALMVAKAFIMSGHLPEAKQIILYLKAKNVNELGEFYQRFNGNGTASEGANNNVTKQLDSIGYYLRMVREFEKASGERLVTDEEIVALAKVIINAEQKFGLVGPEGGVNEGVFGPAFITSSNMFIYGGLAAAIEMLGDHPFVAKIQAVNDQIFTGIENTFVTGQGYKYGYVTYHDELILKYDTPQYFGVLYGFPDTEKMRLTHEYLLQNAGFYEHGIGYSEQEYHHGPWTFNTAACAQYAYKIGDMPTYNHKLNWLKQHSNDYGLMPEAFSADEVNICYINPLVWACAEVVSMLHIGDEA